MGYACADGSASTACAVSACHCPSSLHWRDAEAEEARRWEHVVAHMAHGEGLVEDVNGPEGQSMRDIHWADALGYTARGMAEDD